MPNKLDQSQRLIWEKELLGIYLSEHPLDKYKNYLARPQFTSIKKLLENTTAEQTQLQIAGLISSVKKILTKKNEPMLFVGLEDLSGTIECLVFPRTLKQTSEEFWQEDKIIKITGKMSNRNDEKKVIVDKAIELTANAEQITANNEQRTISQSLQITIPDKAQHRTLAKLKRLLISDENSSSGTQVKLVLPSKKELNLKLKLTATEELKAQINSLLKTQACAIVAV